LADGDFMAVTPDRFQVVAEPADFWCPMPRDDLQAVPSVGPSIAADLRKLGVTSVAGLARRNPERLYRALNTLTGEVQDRCVLYSFRCAVYFARTARPKPELLKWWNWKYRTLGSRGRIKCRPS
jgi:hypothetical protein